MVEGDFQDEEDQSTVYLPNVDTDEGNSIGSMASNVEVSMACPRDGTMEKVRMEGKEGTEGTLNNMADVNGLTHSDDVIVPIPVICIRSVSPTELAIYHDEHHGFASFWLQVSLYMLSTHANLVALGRTAGKMWFAKGLETEDDSSDQASVNFITPLSSQLEEHFARSACD